MIELKPCPLCGGEVKSRPGLRLSEKSDGGIRYNVEAFQCQGCWCLFIPRFQEQDFNARVESPELQELRTRDARRSAELRYQRNEVVARDELEEQTPPKTGNTAECSICHTDKPLGLVKFILPTGRLVCLACSILYPPVPKLK